MYYITIDGGTTNLNAALWNKDKEVLAMCSVEAGAKSVALSNSNSGLVNAVKESIDMLTGKANIDVSACHIIGSGMITSSDGLLEVKHLPAPVSIGDLAKNIVTCSLPDIYNLPFHFIPGLKSHYEKFSIDSHSYMDAMRGEEVEYFAVIKELNLNKDLIIVIPGSHTKFARIDKAGKICNCLTTLSGELLSVITNNTIIASAVKKSFVNAETYSEDTVVKGYKTAVKSGLSRTVFQTRMLSIFENYTGQECANFLLGAVISEDIRAYRSSDLFMRGLEVVVVGDSILSKALTDIFTFEGYEVNQFISKHGDLLAGFGAIEVFTYNS